jgi:hypothetical protein
MARHTGPSRKTVQRCDGEPVPDAKLSYGDNISFGNVPPSDLPTNCCLGFWRDAGRDRINVDIIGAP